MRAAYLLTAVALLGSTELLLRSRGDADQIPPSVPLSLLPMQIGQWTGTDVPIEQYALDVLGKGVFLQRDYMPAGTPPLTGAPASDTQALPARAADQPGVNLFIGYFPTQRTGQAIHSPQNCLPGAGWTFTSKGTTTLVGASGNPATVGEYLITNGDRRDEVLYWYRSHGRSIASDYLAKWYMLSDSIRIHRTDAALVRVVTPLMPGETQQQGHVRAVEFATRLNGLLPPYLPD